MNTVVAAIMLSTTLCLVSIVQLSWAAVDSAKWQNGNFVTDGERLILNG